MTTPLISIIVPNYNHAAFLEQRLESVFNQTYKNIEVILLDDRSSDDSVTILNAYKNNPLVTATIFNDTNSGSPFKQWQRGLEMAKGDWIWIAESDDYCDPNFIASLLSFNEKKNNKAGVLYAQSNDVNAQGEILSNRITYTAQFEPNIWSQNFLVKGTEFIENYLKVKCVIPNASAVLFKRVLLEENPISPEQLGMRMCGDWLFWLRLCRQTYVGFVATPLNSFREHSGVTRNHNSYEKKRVRCSEEKKVREYLAKENVSQVPEISLLYKNWFRQNKVRDIFSRSFYSVRHSSTSTLQYLSLFFKQHKTKEKLSKKVGL